MAKDCVAFSNAQGGVIDYGIEDDTDAPPADQKVSEDIAINLENKISGKTLNVSAHTEILTHENGGQYIRLYIARGTSSASTTSGKYFTRVSDNSVPLTGDDITRLSAEKGYYRWEDEESKWSWKDADKEKLKMLLQNLRNSNRVSEFIKQKEDKELLDYYFLTVEESDKMTNLGVLFIGTQSQRGRLMNAPVVQCIQFDQYGELLNLKNRNELSPWLDKLVDDCIVETSGSKNRKEYRVNAAVLKQSDYKGTTSLKRIEPYRIRELIIEDLKIYECSGVKDMHQRIGIEIPYKKVLEQIKAMLSDGIIELEGENRWVKYKLKKR